MEYGNKIILFPNRKHVLMPQFCKNNFGMEKGADGEFSRRPMPIRPRIIKGLVKVGAGMVKAQLDAAQR